MPTESLTVGEPSRRILAQIKEEMDIDHVSFIGLFRERLSDDKFAMHLENGSKTIEFEACWWKSSSSSKSVLIAMLLMWIPLSNIRTPDFLASLSSLLAMFMRVSSI